MDTTILCGPTAFQFHRIPPCVLQHIEDQPDLSTRKGRRQVTRNGMFLDYLPLPLVIFTDDRNARHRARSVEFELWEHADTNRRTQEIGSYLSVADPLFTLASLARRLDDAHLTMAMYELCGRFSCINLLPEHAAAVLSMHKNGMFPTESGWRPVLDVNKGALTSLWMRNPLVSIDELLDYANRIKGTRGAKIFSRCAERIKGILDSPLEVQAVMLLGHPRNEGGDEFELHLNRAIAIAGEARRLVEIQEAKPDIMIDRIGEEKELIIECQGRSVHGVTGISDLDSNRINALVHMDYDVMTLTSNQLEREDSHREIVKLICKKTGIPYIPKSKREQARERELRQTLFGAWTELAFTRKEHNRPALTLNPSRD